MCPTVWIYISFLIFLTAILTELNSHEQLCLSIFYENQLFTFHNWIQYATFCPWVVFMGQLSRTLAALSRVTVYHSQYQAGSVDERHHHRPSSLPEKYEIRRRRCTSEGARSAFASCGCDPSSTGSPARRSDSGVPFRGGLAQQNVQSYEHLIKFHPFKWSTTRTAQNIAAYFCVHNLWILTQHKNPISGDERVTKKNMI